MTPLSAWSSYDNNNRAHCSRVMELPEVADNSLRVASEKQHGTESENTWNFPIFDTFGRYIWKAIAPRSKHSGTPKLELGVQRVCTIEGSPHPLLVIYTYGTSASDYTHHQNIHYLLYLLWRFSWCSWRRIWSLKTLQHLISSQPSLPKDGYLKLGRLHDLFQATIYYHHRNL